MLVRSGIHLLKPVPAEMLVPEDLLIRALPRVQLQPA